MQGSSYGGYVWNGETKEPYNPLLQQVAAVGVAGTLAYGAVSAATAPGIFNRPAIDSIHAGSRFLGNLSFFSIGNTFSGPEFMYPFLSADGQGLKQSSGGFTWTRDFLKKDETYDYLKKITGLDDSGLQAKGIRKGMVGVETDLASKIYFERGNKPGRGTLYSEVNGKRHELSRDIMLMATEGEYDPLAMKQHKVSRATRGVFQALDMFQGKDKNQFQPENVLAGYKVDPSTGAALKDPVTGNFIHEQARVIPIPSVSGSVSNPGDLGRRTTYHRAMLAFRAARFNDLAEGTVTGIFGSRLGPVINETLGIKGGSVRYGPATHMFLRYGGLAAKVGAAGMAISQTDWMRREYGLPGQALASAGVSAIASYTAGRLGATARMQGMIAAGTFGAQMMFPGFDQGVFQGVATMGVKALQARAVEVNPFNYYRRTLEGFAPGITSWETGALGAVAVGIAAYAKVPTTGMTIPEHLFKKLGPDGLNKAVERVGLGFLKMDQRYITEYSTLPKTTRDIFYEMMHSSMNMPSNLDPNTMRGRFGILRAQYNSATDHYDFLRTANQTWRMAKEEAKESKANNVFTRGLAEKLEAIKTKYPEKDLASRVMMEAEGFAAQAYYGFFGGDMTASHELMKKAEDLGFSKFFVGNRGRLATLMLGTFAAHGVLTGGLLGSMETRQELVDIYEKGKPISVKSSRWWEAGGTPYEGNDTEYYRPHQYYLMMNRAREAGVWGDWDNLSPIKKFFVKNFTYELEKKNYYERPYPISSAAFQDIPIIGGLLGSTIGQIIKPAKLMHVNEWSRENPVTGEVEIASVYKGARMEPSYVLGAVGRGKPTTEFTAGYQAMNAVEQFRELEGMTGWATGIMQQLITGENSALGIGGDRTVLANASAMTSPSVTFWEMNMGGFGFTNEIFRRMFPGYQNKIDRTNPISNNMPSWVPEKYRYGDPYRAVEWGEVRLPGRGYAALHPELRGIDPEAYPDIFKYDILGSIAPTSFEFRQVQQRLYKRRMAGETTAGENKMMDRIDEQVKSVVNKHEFDIKHRNAINLPGSGITSSIYLGLQELAREAVAPVEYLTPMGFRPMQKLTGQNRDMIESYEYERMYGTPLAFWDKPIRDWFRPAAYTAAHFMGFEGKPLHRLQADKLNASYDTLEFIKNMRLAEQAELAGNSQAARDFLYRASQTRTGVNPQGSPMGLYWSLPEADRKFFNSFAHATGSDRERILEMIPEDQVHLYKAVWSRMDSGDPNLWAGASTQLDANSMREMYYGLTNSGMGIPQEDWIGWHEDVDMDDIRVRHVDQLGRELADYGLWEKQLKKSMGQEFLDASVPADLPNANAAIQMQSRLRRSFGSLQNRGTLTTLQTQGAGYSQIDYNDDRTLEVMSLMGDRY